MCCTRYWYTYNGLPTDTAAGRYVSPTTTQPSCIGGGTACAVFVCSGAVNPDPGTITANIQNYLTIAKQNSYQFYPLTGQPYVGTRLP